MISQDTHALKQLIHKGADLSAKNHVRQLHELQHSSVHRHPAMLCRSQGNAHLLLIECIVE